MPDPSREDSPGPVNHDRLNGWKEIAAYLGKGVRTVQRWEADLGLPIRRIHTGNYEIMWTSKREVDQWSREDRAATQAETRDPRCLTLSGPDGTVEITKPVYARGSFAGTVALTRPAGRHPLAEGIGALTVAGLRGVPKVERNEGRLRIEVEGVRITLRSADACTVGETLHISLPARR